MREMELQKNSELTEEAFLRGPDDLLVPCS
jgi:hypothetical protein